MFEIKQKDGLARIGKLELIHGTIQTPAIMPVVNPSIELIPIKRLEEEFDVQILITNSYIIYTNEKFKEKAREKSVRGLLNFSGPVMTDSGTFQAHVYGDIDIEAKEILKFQKEIGSDILTILDEFTEPHDSREIANKKVEKTVKRAKEAKKIHDSLKGEIAFPVQGSLFPDLRKYCAEVMGELGGGVYPIGGVVPLMEEYRFRELVEVILASKKGLGPRGPVHLFGAGHPMLYSLAVLLGCDLFDSSSYAKYAKRGDMMYSSGTKNIKNIKYLGCECPVCTSHQAEELEYKFDKGDIAPIAEHNLWVSFREIDRIKQAIMEGKLWEFTEQRVRGHPLLLDSLDVLKGEYDYLERYEPRSREGAALYTGKETSFRPNFRRIQNWIMESYSPPKDGPTVYFEEPERKPYARALRKEISLLEEYDVNLLVSTVFGPVPLELDEIYPIAQSILPSHVTPLLSLDDYKDEKQIDELILWEGEGTLDSLSRKEDLDFDEMRIKAVADYQFIKGAGEVLTDGELDYVKNKKGRIKNVILDGEHILSMRHYDGFFTLKEGGARRLWKEFSPPDLRIEVVEDSVEFNRQGKSVFSKFVSSISSDLRPGDEALVVDKEDDLVAVGRIFLNEEEIDTLDKGLAARVRDGFEAR